GAAVSGSVPSADVPLKPGDILSIHQITNWDDIGESVTIKGEVRFPGSYGFHEGERLSSVLRRASGLLPTAYPMGAGLIIHDCSRWVKRAGLQWAHRTMQDPGRLCKRHLRNNPAFLWHIGAQISGLRHYHFSDDF